MLGLTPNTVTAFSALLSLSALAVIAVAPATVGLAILAAVLLLAGYALDSADGQLARLTGTGSVAGEWLDHVVDAARLPLFHLAIAIHFFLAGEPLWLVFAALLFLTLSSFWFFAQTLAEKLSPAPPARPSTSSDQPIWMSFVKLPYDVGTLYLTVLTLANPPVFATLYLALFATTALVTALSLRRKYRLLKNQTPRNRPDSREWP